MKKGHLLLLAALFTTSCGPRFSNIRLVPLYRDNPRALVVIDERLRSRLGYVDNKNRLHFIDVPLNILSQLGRLTLSPNHQRVLIESYGEGHQFLSIFQINNLLARHNGNNACLKGWRTLDPYPYSFGNIRWITDHCITFSSNSDMSQFDSELRRGKAPSDDAIAPVRTWRWYLDSDTFEEVNSPQ